MLARSKQGTFEARAIDAAAALRYAFAVPETRILHENMRLKSEVLLFPGMEHVIGQLREHYPGLKQQRTPGIVYKFTVIIL